MTTDQFETPLQFSNNCTIIVTIVQFNLVFSEEHSELLKIQFSLSKFQDGWYSLLPYFGALFAKL